MKFTVYWLILVACLLLNVKVSAQDANPNLHTIPNLQYLGSYFTDFGRVVASPAGWDKDDFYALGLVGLGTSLIVTQDLWLQQTITKRQSKFTDWAAKHICEPMGNYQFAVGSAAVFYSIGLITGKDRPKQTALLSLKAFVVAGAMGQLFKRMGGRKRPYQFPADPNSYDWSGFSFKYHSFPSGHTNVAFAVATVIAEMYKDVILIPITAYTLATFAGLSRIHDNAHWASDVFAGAALGWAVGRFMVRSANSRLKAAPYVGSAGAGLSMSYKF